MFITGNSVEETRTASLVAPLPPYLINRSSGEVMRLEGCNPQCALLQIPRTGWRNPRRFERRCGEWSNYTTFIIILSF